MRMFGLTIARTKDLAPVRSNSSWWWGVIRESLAGAWQRNIEVESKENILAFSAVYACVSLIAEDVAKLRIKLVELQPSGVWDEIPSGSPFLPVLRKPNPWQTRIQFVSLWMVSKLLHGNAYVLKERDQRGVVTGLYVLDPRLVTPLVSDEGAVYYRLDRDNLAGLQEPVVIPAEEIIHDRMLCLWHPLVGVSPIYACGTSATQGIRIQNNSAAFFTNMSRPSGQLTAPGTISDENAARLKKAFEDNFSGGNIGRLLVTGDGLKYEPMTIPANDAQLIEQLRWTVEDVARCFHVPMHKLGAGQPTVGNVAALNQDYYSQCLQSLIEALELLLDEGLSLPTNYGTELDLDGLLRMDPSGLADYLEKSTRGFVMSPDEARLKLNLPPVPGGRYPYAQQQNYSLEALAKRDAQSDPFAPAASASPPAPPSDMPEDMPDAEDMPEDMPAARAFADALIKGFAYA